MESVDITELSVTGRAGFHIGPSHDDGIGTNPVALVPPNREAYANYLRETLDPTDRRARYPFTACTYCGPRFTMVTGLHQTGRSPTMVGFPLCPLCQQEYDDPADRDHVAAHCLSGVRPVADVPQPHTTRMRSATGRWPLLFAVLEGGGIVAVKGVGGYHLACDATRPDVVSELRQRKRRSDKPFAVLVPSIEGAQRLVDVDDVAKQELTSPVAPIVVSTASWTHRARPLLVGGAARALGRRAVSPTPTAPLAVQPHPLRSGGWVPEVLVFTSANLADEPICTDPGKARRRARRDRRCLLPPRPSDPRGVRRLPRRTGLERSGTPGPAQPVMPRYPYASRSRRRRCWPLAAS